MPIRLCDMDDGEDVHVSIHNVDHSKESVCDILSLGKLLEEGWSFALNAVDDMHAVLPTGQRVNISLASDKTLFLAHDITSICWCPEVESVSIPASVDRIPNYLFNNCRNLTSVKFVGKGPLATIGASAFAGTSITSIEIPDYITHIYSNAFEYAPITKVTFGSGLKEVAQHAFYGTKLKQVKLPKNAIYYTGLFATFPIGTRAPSPTGIRSQVCKVMGGESCDWTKMECECRRRRY